MTAEEIVKILRRNYQGEGHIFVTNVATTTGITTASRYGPLTSRRFIDAYVMCLWPSLGYKRIAYEIKVSRSDWLKEIKDLSKLAQAFFLCDEFVFVLAPGVYEQGDLEGRMFDFGLLEVQENGRLKVIWKGRRIRWGWPMPIDFVASLLRRVRDEAKEGREDEAEGCVPQGVGGARAYTGQAPGL